MTCTYFLKAAVHGLIKLLSVAEPKGDGTWPTVLSRKNHRVTEKRQTFSGWRLSLDWVLISLNQILGTIISR